MTGQAVSAGFKATATRFTKGDARSLRDGTLYAKGMVPEGMESPFTLDWIQFEGGQETSEENHPVNKAFSVVSGKATAHVGNEAVELSPGAVLWVPSNTPHWFSVPADAPIQMTVTKWTGAKS